MTIEYIPLLPTQRQLYGMPRNYERFRAYLAAITNDDQSDVAVPPLIAMNPMGKDHCGALLDQYLALDADVVAQATLQVDAAGVDDLPDTLRASLVLVDDAKGGWTDRTAYEYSYRAGAAAVLRRYPWLSIFLWTSEPSTKDAIVNATQLTFFRAVHALRHGDPQTLGEILAQEGWAMTMAGLPTPPLHDEELAYSAEVLAPLLSTPADDMPTIVAALFGDAAAASLGYPSLGLSENAGLAVARYDEKPERLRDADRR